MGKRKFMKLFSSILAFVMVLSIMMPVSAEGERAENKTFKQVQQNEKNMMLKAAIAEQHAASEGLPRLHKDLQGKSGNELIPVIIHLSENPVALEKGISELKGKTLSNSKISEIRSKIKRQQATVDSEILAKGIKLTKGFKYDTVLNGFAAKVKADDLKKLLDITGITWVEPDAIVYAAEEDKPTDPASSELEKVVKYETQMNTSIDHLGIENIWDKGYKGAGIKVAVLDTGIDPEHPEFQEIYKGGKNFIVHDSKYARNRADDDARETSPLDRAAGQPEFDADGRSFYTDHGTHVAGTIAAIGANQYGIKGIAPEVDLYAYRVLGAYGSGATSGIISAVEHAVNEEMDVINLSLGGGSNSENDSLSYAINNSMMAGVISVVSSGNSGPNRGTVSTPGTSRLGIIVGNTTNPETQHVAEVTVTVGEDYNFSKQLKFMGTTFGQDLATQLAGEFELVAVPGVGAVSDYDGIDVEGKVALISRGELAFVDKIANAKANGAVATIIHNFSGGTNAPDVSNVFLGDSFAFIPTIDMSVTDGTAIRDALKAGSGTVTFGNYGQTNSEGDQVNDSSSRGPSTPNFDIKPDVTAPGTNIMSSVPAYKWDFPDASYEESYDRFTGTSMSAPHITGIAALIQQANPDWDAFDVKVALSNTAKLLDTSKYDVFAQGAGRVDAYAAVFPSVLAYAEDEAVLDASGEVVPNIKGTVTFGPQKLDKNITVTKQVRVKDLKGAGGDLNVSVNVTKAFGDAKVTVDKTSFTLAPNGEQLLNVTLTASKTTTKAGDEILGYIHINGGANHISLPFAADFSGEAATEIRDMRITETDLSFNGDGVKDEAMLYFTITGDVGTNYLELWNIEDPDGGYYQDGYIGYLHAGNSLGAGSYQLRIAGQYTPWAPPQTATKIPDGVYTIDYTALATSGVIGDYVGPIFVKSTSPKITGQAGTDKITGNVTDKYVDYKEVLSPYGLDYDLNTKLSATYVATSNGVAGSAVPLTLSQDGSFEINVPNDAESVTVNIVDAAGNKGKADFTVEKPVEVEVSLAVDQSKVTIEEGQTANVVVTQTTKEGDKITEEDVTAKATYTVADAAIATAEAGVITAKAAGETTVTISYGGNELTVNVTVVKGNTDPDPETTYNLVADKDLLLINKGASDKVKITEIATAGDKITFEDVTSEATYKVSNEKIATVQNGVIIAKAVGVTEVTATYRGNSVTIIVAVADTSSVRPPRITR
ncbi:S8 family serine peptidase [Bacillus sp. REN16]|uniref:S8 family serine peptidase n=1 Tax=Bacillus sp. REN16 TaxID=2887296 RepID=UPI001E4C6ABC|nr:S8 family serine peptidase [Bacillus sp. REN16]MCC3356731.1 S8 family serine peptidase [Bacillus sp. REN16]